MPKRTCKYCGEDISHKRRDANFCNALCGKKFRFGPIIRNRKCKQCEKNIDHQARNAIFCSRFCQHRFSRGINKEGRKCKVCKNSMEGYLNAEKYCSNVCRNSVFVERKRLSSALYIKRHLEKARLCSYNYYHFRGGKQKMVLYHIKLRTVFKVLKEAGLIKKIKNTSNAPTGLMQAAKELGFTD